MSSSILSERESGMSSLAQPASTREQSIWTVREAHQDFLRIAVARAAAQKELNEE